jgi:hypothetical protein
MGGVSRLYLQAYLDEYYWRLVNGNRNGWLIYTAVIKAIRDYFELCQDANNENYIINASDDNGLDFGEYPNDKSDLALGDINNFSVSSTTTPTTTTQPYSILPDYETSLSSNESQNSPFK